MSVTMFVDPGTRKLGWSKFVDDGVGVWVKKSGVLEEKERGVGWRTRVDRMVRNVVRLGLPPQRGIDRHAAIGLVVIELPRHWSGGSERGEGAKNSGAILKLMFLIGALRQALLERGYAVELLEVEKWKGNVPKAITARRVRKWWGIWIEEGDEADALGMGDYWFRKRKDREKLRVIPR